MVPVEDLTKHGYCVYTIVVGAAKRARIINDWRLQRARILYEETPGPKATTQALMDIAGGEVSLTSSEKHG